MRRIFYFLTVVIGSTLSILSFAYAEDNAGSIAKEYLVKAVYLYNFVKYVQWPGDKSLAQTHAANICIIGDDPFGEALDVVARQAAANQVILNIKRNISESQIPSCHILFINASQEERLSPILSRAEHHSVLTVSEISGFVEKGGIIEMVKVEKSIGLFSKDKINLRINLKEAQEEDLHIDAQLLAIVAEVIK